MRPTIEHKDVSCGLQAEKFALPPDIGVKFVCVQVSLDLCYCFRNVLGISDMLHFVYCQLELVRKFCMKPFEIWQCFVGNVRHKLQN